MFEAVRETIAVRVEGGGIAARQGVVEVRAEDVLRLGPVENAVIIRVRVERVGQIAIHEGEMLLGISQAVSVCIRVIPLTRAGNRVFVLVRQAVAIGIQREIRVVIRVGAVYFVLRDVVEPIVIGIMVAGVRGDVAAARLLAVGKPVSVGVFAVGVDAIKPGFRQPEQMFFSIGESIAVAVRLEGVRVVDHGLPTVVQTVAVGIHVEGVRLAQVRLPGTVVVGIFLAVAEPVTV